jgi:hypothetical protein
MELEQGGALLDGKICDPLQLVHVVEREREDKAEGDAGGAECRQTRAHVVECPRGVPHEVVGFRDAVEADRDKVAISP